jgi:hypothetical protein
MGSSRFIPSISSLRMVRYRIRVTTTPNPCYIASHPSLPEEHASGLTNSPKTVIPTEALVDDNDWAVNRIG